MKKSHLGVTFSGFYPTICGCSANVTPDLKSLVNFGTVKCFLGQISNWEILFLLVQYF